MTDPDEFDIMRDAPVPVPREAARAQALATAMSAYEEKTDAAPQGSVRPLRLTDRAIGLWRGMMSRKLMATPAIATLVALPLAGYTAFYLIERERPFAVDTGSQGTQAPAAKPAEGAEAPEPAPVAEEEARDAMAALEAPAQQAEADQPLPEAAPPVGAGTRGIAAVPMPAGRVSRDLSVASSKLVAPAPPADFPAAQAENRDRIADIVTNPVKSTAEDPVSTFSIDVDSAAYSFVRRSLNSGRLPRKEAVRVEEMINYFPYDYPLPEDRSAPFKPTVTVLPAPWNTANKLIHIAIKGFDVARVERPRANLVLLIDTSGSMAPEDRLPLLKNAFRMLIDTLRPDDTVGIVTYAGTTRVALEPTKVADKRKILEAIDGLNAGGGTAGGSGIQEAYRMAEGSFDKTAVNRVLLATDGDFNVGITNIDELKSFIER